jgi:hypothetical protein
MMVSPEVIPEDKQGLRPALHVLDFTNNLTL